MGSKHHYVVSISTNSEYDDAGTRSRVQMRIMGVSEETTEWITLNAFLPDIIGTGESRTYKLETPDMGKPILVELRLVGRTDDPWHCNEISVTHHGKTFQFPFYDWVGATEVAVSRGKGCLPQQEKNAYVKEKRRAEVEQNKTNIAWMPKPEPDSLSYGLPRHLPVVNPDDLPPIFRWTDEKVNSFDEANSVATDLVGRNIRANFPLDSLDSFKKIYAGLAESPPPFIDVWDTDEELGRQMLNGLSPLLVEQCQQLPSYCNISDDNCLLSGNRTLEEEMKACRIFITDFKPIIEGVPNNFDPTAKKPLFAPEAIGLFQAARDGTFKPIAIQLTPNDPESVFSPKDSADDWLLAKMYFQTTKMSVHQWIYHYLNTHAVTEAIAIATFRNFPRSHPLYKLLRPRLRPVVRINTVARTTLIPPTSLANLSLAVNAGGLAQKSYQNFDFSMLDIPKHFETKGTDNEHILPTYHYRDDALGLWENIDDLVDDIIDEYYHSDEDVVNDFELQAWVEDLGTEGFGWLDGNRRGVPESIQTVDELTRICTMIIFNATAQHAGINFGQFQIYQFVPNNPPSMRLPVFKKGEANLERMLTSLPDITMASFDVGITYSLSQFADNEVYIGEVKHELFTSRKVKRHQRRFARKLKRLSRKIHRRNKRLTIPYTYLLPERIPNSVAA